MGPIRLMGPMGLLPRKLCVSRRCHTPIHRHAHTPTRPYAAAIPEPRPTMLTLRLRSIDFEHDALECVQLIGVQNLFYFLAF